MNTIDEAIHLVDHDPTWASSFCSERTRIASVVGYSAQNIEHIGSTAVAALVAKPVIDIMVGVDDWPPAEIVSEAICKLGYESFGEAGVPERLYFRLRGAIHFNVQVVRFGGQHWRSNIALRNYLRNSKSACDRYAEVKRHAISSGASKLLAYSAAKSSTVTQLINEALSQSG